MKIVANSLPKSGTHLLIRFLELLGFTENHPGLGGGMIKPSHRNPIRAYFTNKKRCLNQEKNCFSIDLDNKDNKIKSEYLDKYLNSIKDDFFIMGHLPYSDELDKYIKAHNFKFLYIIRDPRAVLLSYYNHQHKDPTYPFYYYFKDKTVKETYKDILNGMQVNNVTLSPLKDRVANSQGWLNSENVMGIKFEELIGPKGGGDYNIQIETIKRALAFLEIDKTPEEIKEIADKVFFPKSETFHKGQIDSWKEEFDEDMLSDINNEIGNLLIELGYE